ncbi:unnamed protein product, partial [Ranitomeya imitator]
LFQNKGSLQFEDKWDFMRPIVLKLLRQESVTKQQWFDLFSDVHAVCLWDDKGPAKIHQALKEDILDFIKQAQARVLSHQDDTALLKAYIVEWRKFFTQCDILPKPFCQLEITLMGKQGSNKKSNVEDSIVRKLMLDTWNESIFSNIKNRLQDSAMKLVHAERLGEAFDSQLVIGVRESYVNLCSNPEDKLQIYRDNFEKAYLDSTERFYRTQAPSYLQQNGVQNYMKYADAKLREEEKRAVRYLETRRECNSVQATYYSVHVGWALLPKDGIVRHRRSAALTGGARPIAAGCHLLIAADIRHYVPGAVTDRPRHINPRHTAIKHDRDVPAVQGSIAQGGGSLRASLRSPAATRCDRVAPVVSYLLPAASPGSKMAADPGPAGREVAYQVPAQSRHLVTLQCCLTDR